MNTTPALALTFAYWLHMLATVIWIGGLAALSIFVLPAARRVLDPPAYSGLLTGLQRRFDPLSWFSLAVLGATGMFQMSASPQYSGFLAIDNRWAAAILVKHLVFLSMAAISAYMTWGLLPQIRRLALLRSRLDQGDKDPSERLADRELKLLQINLILGVVALLLTAAARAA